MAGPSQTYWRVAYEYRYEARRYRTAAAEKGAKLMKDAPDLPGDTMKKIREILDNLEDPEMAEKASELAKSLLDEFHRAVDQVNDLLGNTPSREAVELVNKRLFQWKRALNDVAEIGKELDIARQIDIAARAMMEMGDFAAGQGL
jgi:hypothetical protein